MLMELFHGIGYAMATRTVQTVLTKKIAITVRQKIFVKREEEEEGEGEGKEREKKKEKEKEKEKGKLDDSRTSMPVLARPCSTSNLSLNDIRAK